MTRYQVIEPLWDGSRWHQPGQPYPPEGHEVPEETLRRYHGVFIATPDEIARKANPEAHGARTELQKAQARVVELEAQLAALPSENTGEAGSDDAVTLQAVTAEREQLRTQLQDARSRINEQTAELLALRGAQPGQEGTPLPHNLKHRGKYVGLGLDTVEKLMGRTAEQLDSIEGITLEDAQKALESVTPKSDATGQG